MTSHPSVAAAAAAIAFLTLGASSRVNVARGRKYALQPRPAYQHCTDAGDAIQLTDGKLSQGYFWTQKETVGWVNSGYAAITIDLERVEPIGGVSFRTAAGTAGVEWPHAVHLLVSDDGKAYREVGDLMALERNAGAAFPDGYAVRRLATDRLRTRGRYVRFLVIPSGPFIFSDEVEVFRGGEELLRKDPGGRPAPADPHAAFVAWRVRDAIRHRFDEDRSGIQAAIRDAPVEAPARKRLLERLDAAARACDPETYDPATFRAVIPYGDAHARLFAVQGELWKAIGRSELSAWVAPAWDPLDLYAVPPRVVKQGRLAVSTMRGEYRSTALNLASSGSRPLPVRLRFEGLPGGPTPEYITLHEVPWTDTAQGRPVAAALPQAPRKSNAWQTTLLPGLPAQVWLTVHVRSLKPDKYTGLLLVEAEGRAPLRVPVHLRVYPVDFPRETTLLVGGWSYTNGRGAYGLTAQNRAAFVSHLKEHCVNAPWARSGVMMPIRFDGNGRAKLDTREMDAWLDEWPDARRYCVFLSVGPSLAPATPGTKEFTRRVGAWITAWAAHLKARGIAPDRLALLLLDEPYESRGAKPLIPWARAIHAAQPDVLIWEDPIYRDPGAAPKELWEVCDVLCPNRVRWLEASEAFRRFFRKRREHGTELQFYSCSGPARLLDPYSYYRLQAWQCWQEGATGSFFWAFGDNGGASSWSEYAVGTRGYTPLMVDDRTVTAAKQMEAIRESAEDYEYLVILRDSVRRARRDGRSDAAIQRAEALLAEAARRVLGAPGAGGVQWHEARDRTVADTVRVEILEVLADLTSS